MPDPRQFNLFTDPTDIPPEASDPSGYAARSARLGPRLGAERIGMNVYDLPPGEAICPYHLDWTDEEWLIVISGTPQVRSPAGERQLEAGDVVCFPAGPGGAHQVSNASSAAARVAMFSTRNDVGVAEYPDSDKIGVWVGDVQYMLRRTPQVDYWDGETRRGARGATRRGGARPPGEAAP